MEVVTERNGCVRSNIPIVEDAKKDDHAGAWVFGQSPALESRQQSPFLEDCQDPDPDALSLVVEVLLLTCPHYRLHPSDRYAARALLHQAIGAPGPRVW